VTIQGTVGVVISATGQGLVGVTGWFNVMPCWLSGRRRWLGDWSEDRRRRLSEDWLYTARLALAEWSAAMLGN
jgi:hypothetical protein